MEKTTEKRIRLEAEIIGRLNEVVQFAQKEDQQSKRELIGLLSSHADRVGALAERLAAAEAKLAKQEDLIKKMLSLLMSVSEVNVKLERGLIEARKETGGVKKRVFVLEDDLPRRVRDLAGKVDRLTWRIVG